LIANKNLYSLDWSVSTPTRPIRSAVYMNIDEQRQDELKHIDNQIKRTYFFERGDGFILACEENEAWGLLRGQGNWARRDFTFLGSSDGQTYQRIIRDGKKDNEDLKAEIETLKRDVNRYLKTLEKFKFDDLLDDTDSKVIKANEIISRLEKALEDKQKEFNGFAKMLNKKAFNAELEIAKQNKTIPSNQDIITPGATDSYRNSIINNVSL